MKYFPEARQWYFFQKWKSILNAIQLVIYSFHFYFDTKGSWNVVFICISSTRSDSSYHNTNFTGTIWWYLPLILRRWLENERTTDPFASPKHWRCHITAWETSNTQCTEIDLSHWFHILIKENVYLHYSIANNRMVSLSFWRNILTCFDFCLYMERSHVFCDQKTPAVIHITKI